MILPAARPYASFALLAACTLPAWAAPAAPAAAPAAPARFKVVVTAESAVILAGSSKAYYAVGRMPRGSVLEVVDASYVGYHQITPPGCCAAFVAKNKVTTDAKGAVATVTEDGAECFAAGLELTPAKSFRVQRKLKKGETLDILGVVGDYYRVEEPADTTVFVAAESVRKATASDLTENGPPEAKPDFKPGAAETGPKTAKTPVKKPEPTAPAPKTPEPVTPTAKDDGIDSPAADPALRAAEGRLLAAYGAAKDTALPSATAKILLAEYKTLAQRTDFNPVDSQLAHGRVAQLTRQLKISEALEKVTTAEQKAIEAGKPPATPAKIGYDAVGQLKISTVYSGANLPALYRLADPTTDHTIAYVIPGSLENPGELLNKLVGIQGQIEVDPTLKLRVVRIKKIEVLKADDKPAHTPTK